jgi:hypothetical protein
MGGHPGYERARRLLGEGELADAIGAFLRAVEEQPEHAESYFGLMRAYELAYEVFPDPELLHQVQNVLRGLRDLDLDPAQQSRAAEVERRVEARLAAAGHPPPAPRRTPAA